MDKATAGAPAVTRFCTLVFPEQCNHYGTLIGGETLRLMDLAAFVAASRHARAPVVTARSDAVDFLVPVPQGDLAEVSAWVTGEGRRSMSVSVELTGENLNSGQRSLAARGTFIMVRAR